ncbi:hypothetical protein ACJMK2_009670, partial [Sinanodonta woodiana]
GIGREDKSKGAIGKGEQIPMSLCKLDYNIMWQQEDNDGTPYRLKEMMIWRRKPVGILLESLS